MKKILHIVFCAISLQASAQQYVCRTGRIHFFSKSPIENLEATSTQSICVFNTETQKIVAKMPITSFQFVDKLMQEHFNENYLESDKFPYSTLTSVIVEKIDYSKDGDQDVTLAGVLEMHGVKKACEIKGHLNVKNGVPATAMAEFIVKLADYDIKIPKAVMFNIAEEIKVDVAFIFEKYEKK